MQRFKLKEVQQVFVFGVAEEIEEKGTRTLGFVLNLHEPYAC
jgi:hypothetical protein